MDGPSNCCACHAYEVKTKYNKQYYETSRRAEDCDSIAVEESFHEDIIVMSSFVWLMCLKQLKEENFYHAYVYKTYFFLDITNEYVAEVGKAQLEAQSATSETSAIA